MSFGQLSLFSRPKWKKFLTNRKSGVISLRIQALLSLIRWSKEIPVPSFTPRPWHLIFSAWDSANPHYRDSPCPKSIYIFNGAICKWLTETCFLTKRKHLTFSALEMANPDASKTILQNFQNWPLSGAFRSFTMDSRSRARPGFKLPQKTVVERFGNFVHMLDMKRIFNYEIW